MSFSSAIISLSFSFLSQVLQNSGHEKHAAYWTPNLTKQDKEVEGCKEATIMMGHVI